MQEIWYVAISFNWPEETAALDDAAKGRLTDAIVRYGRGDADYADGMSGEERYVFPVFRARVDRMLEEARATIERNRENGRKGARASQRRAAARGAGEGPAGPGGADPINTDTKTQTENQTQDQTQEGYSDDDEESDNVAQAGACVRARVESAWRRCFGEKPNPEVARTLARWVTFYNYDDGAMVDELVSTVALNNAKNPVGYAVEVLRDWRRRRVLGVEDLE